MRTTLALLLCLLGACTQDSPTHADLIGEVDQHLTTPLVGMPVIYRYDSTHQYPGVISSLHDGFENLVVFSPTYDGMYVWPFGPNSQGYFATLNVNGVTEADATHLDNRWTPNLAGMGPPGATGAPGPDNDRCRRPTAVALQ